MVKIRACIASDFEQIFSLLQQLWPDKSLCRQRLRAVYECGLASGTQRYLCAVEEGRIAAFCSITLKNNLRVEGTLANIDEMVVNHGDRGRGIGSQLLQVVIGFAKERGCTRLELESAFHRVQTHEFYKRRGFQSRAYHFSMPLV
jgi:GNAT superfamily N-acetyltransferase